MTPQRNSDYPISPGQTQRQVGLSNAKLLTIVGGILFALVSWIATAETTARQKISDDLARSVQRIAVLEEAVKNVRESQQRIEGTLEEIRRQLQQERRR